MRARSDTYHSGMQTSPPIGSSLGHWIHGSSRSVRHAGRCWYIQTGAAIARVEAISRECVAAIERGVPLPEREPEPPKPPERAGHPLKPTLASLAVGIALLLGLAPSHRVWGMVVTALGIAGVCHGSRPAGTSGNANKSWKRRCTAPMWIT